MAKRGIFDVDASFNYAISMAIDYSDSKYHTNEPCDYHKDLARCVGGDNKDTAETQYCADAPGDDKGYCELTSLHPGMSAD